jgi:class 3 adenylate cyclase
VLLGNLTCVDAMWEDPHFALVLRRLAALGRVICFDWRGHGASDPVPLGALPTIDAWSDDARVVLDAVGSRSATLIGVNVGASPMAIFLAAAFPERTDALVLVNGMARSLRADDYQFGQTDEAVTAVLGLYEDRWGTGEVGARLVPSRADDESFRGWHARYERLAMSPSTVRALLGWALQLDVRDVLHLVRVPTLVLHAERTLAWPIEHSRYLADRIEGARLAILPGGDVTLYGKDSEAALDHIEEFLTGGHPVHDHDRVLATVLFTDIVRSTEHAGKMGDRRWAQLLNEHDALVIRELQRYRGRKVNTTGDGFLATFDGPARAVRCALAICEGVRPLGIEVRVGLHTGEVELRGNDIGGIAVHIGQRVSGLASAGKVLVSATVKDLVAGSGIQFADHGEHDLKGVPGTWRLFGVES